MALIKHIHPDNWWRGQEENHLHYHSQEERWRYRDVLSSLPFLLLLLAVHQRQSTWQSWKIDDKFGIINVTEFGGPPPRGPLTATVYNIVSNSRRCFLEVAREKCWVVLKMLDSRSAFFSRSWSKCNSFNSSSMLKNPMVILLTKHVVLEVNKVTDINEISRDASWTLQIDCRLGIN